MIKALLLQENEFMDVEFNNIKKDDSFKFLENNIYNNKLEIEKNKKMFNEDFLIKRRISNGTKEI